MSDILNQKQETTLPTELGTVRVKVPSLPQRLLIERKRTAYAGGFTVLSNMGADLAEMFATIDVIVLECDKLQRKQNDPSSWDYDVLSEFDYDKLLNAYTEVSKWLNSFRQGMGN
jgi:hypothetical protein